MKMRVLLGFILLYFCATRNASGVVLSATNNGFFLAVGAWQPLSGGKLDENAPIRFDEKFVWEPFSNVGAVRFNYPNPRFGIKVSMTGPDGKAVRKTEEGAAFGLKFDSVRTFDDAISGWTMGSIDAREKYVEAGRGFSGATIPAPMDLFQMERAGEYTLEIRILIFRIIETTPTHWDRELLRFEPVRIKVKKP